MAIPHYNAYILKRGGNRSAVGMSAYGSGKAMRVGSVVAAASYRAGEPLNDQQLGVTFDYSDREDVLHTEILTPEKAPVWASDRERLWNAVEQAEKRKDAQLARSIIVALPRELTLEENIQLLRAHVTEQFTDRGMIADVAIHENDAQDGGKNPHAHILLTLREVNEHGVWATRKNREWNGYNEHGIQTGEVMKGWRAAWEEKVNAFLDEAGSTTRLSMQSYRDQGVDQRPGMHLGYKNHAAERKGFETGKGNLNRAIKQENTVREMVSGWQPEAYTQEDIEGYYLRQQAREAAIDEPSIEALQNAGRSETDDNREYYEAKVVRRTWYGSIESTVYRPGFSARPHRDMAQTPQQRQDRHNRQVQRFISDGRWDISAQSRSGMEMFQRLHAFTREKAREIGQAIAERYGQWTERERVRERDRDTGRDQDHER